MKRLVLIVLGIVIAATAFLGAGAKPASAALNDAVIKSNSTSSAIMTICRDWGSSGGSPCGAGVGYLTAGQNSKTKYGWGDTDGILNVKSGWCLFNLSNRIVKYGNNDDQRNDFKVTGMNGLTATFRLGRC